MINTGLLLILNKINSIFRTNLELTDITVSYPILNTTVLPARNTTIVVTYKLASSKKGNESIHYNRIHTSELPPITITKGNATKFSDLLEQINQNYNLSLSVFDILDRDITDIPDGDSVIELPISPNSYIYYTGDKIVTDRRPKLEYEVNTLVSHICKGNDKYSKLSDGRGGYYYTLEELNCIDCLYELIPTITPTPTST